MRKIKILATLLISLCASSGDADSLSNLPEAARIHGGVIIHLGCRDAKKILQLHVDDRHVVQALDTEPARVARARATFRAAGHDGRVTANEWNGVRLPYVDNLVNLLVVADCAKLTAAEIARIVCPAGKVCFPFAADAALVTALQQKGFTVAAQSGWTICRKPRPADIDEWTHFLHGPNNNAVARDRVVAPPRSMQWIGGPRYSRHHDRMSSISAVVSSGGRVFSVVDEAPPVSILTPPQWKLIARDAFNGTILWRRPITRWHPHLHKLKSGPADLPRKLVAVDDRVYVTLELYGPVQALDAASGQTHQTFENTAGAEEILVVDNTLYVQVNKARLEEGSDPALARRTAATADFHDAERTIVAFDVTTGGERWSVDYPVLKGTLAADQQNVVFVSRDRILCLDGGNGQLRWQSESVPRLPDYPVRFTPTLVLYDDVVLFAGGELAGAMKRGNRSWDVNQNDTLTALSADNGKILWKNPHPHSGYASSEDVLVINGVVWVGETSGGAAVGTIKGYDVHSGEVVKQFDPDVNTYWFHHRCYRGKATENFLLISRTGTEFVDVNKEHWDINHWVRGACLYGLMPANGLLYAPPHPCACFLEAKQSGFNALAGERPKPVDDGKAAERLTKGPAYASTTAPAMDRQGHEEPAHAVNDWPTFRGDNARRGMIAAGLSSDLQPAWTAEVGGRLSAMTAAGGRVYVASIDRHTLHALSAETGDHLWHFTAGGRVDSPPTCWQDRVVFGSADGHVYCLSADDGGLAWRLRAAPSNAQITAFEQLESVWPVHGSVLIHDDVLYCVAGRSVFLDHGLRLLRLNPRSGEVLSTTVLDQKDRQRNRDLQDYARQLNMPTGLPDILSTDGKFVYMRSQPFTLDGKRLPLEALEYTAKDPEQFGITVVQNPDHAHLFSPTGFLDGSWWHRTYWVYGSHFFSGWSGYARAGTVTPAGRMLVMDDEQVYGFGRKPQYYRWTTPLEHMLFSASKDLVPVRAVKGKLDTDAKNPRVHKWTKEIPLFCRAMLLGGNVLFLAGPDDIVDEEQLARKWQDQQIRQLAVKQAEMFQGKHGGTMWAVDGQTGQRLAEWKLDTIPVFDGMAAADGRLFLAGVDGRITCFE